MANIKVRFFITIVTLIAFFGPFLAIIVIEGVKRENKLISDQQVVATAKKDAEEAQYQYYLGVAQQRDSLRQSMADAKTQYDQLLKDQPKLVSEKQKIVTQTTLEPVVTQEVTMQPVTTTSKTSAAPVAVTPKTAALKPVATTKTS